MMARRLLALATAGREAAAFARQAVLLRHDLAENLPSGVAEGDDVVVFLHGLFATAGVLRPMRLRVARHPGVFAATLSYPPGPGLELIAARLGVLIAELPPGCRIHLVGHSLGGIVMRLYAQEFGDARVVQTISMASPFAGVPRAALLRFGGARDLDPASPLLRRIRLGAALCEVPHLSIVAGEDAVVRSPVAHAFPGGEVVVLAGRGHNAVLFDDEAGKLVEERVLRRLA